MIRNMAIVSPSLEWEWMLTGGVMVVHQGDQSLRLPSIVEKQFSPSITSEMATELCRCGRCVTPGGREFMATVRVGRAFRLASFWSDEKIRAEPAAAASRPT